MRRGAGALLGPLLFVALTGAVGIWSLRTTSSTHLVSTAVKATPDVPTISVGQVRTAKGDFQAGVSVVVYGNDLYFDHKAKVLLNRLAGLGANSVSLVVPVFQHGVTDSTVYRDPLKTPRDAKIMLFATEAHRRGFTVMLRPLLDIGAVETPTDWRGTLRPDAPDQWQQAYAELVMAYAQLARSSNIEVLDIGSELDSMERSSPYWLGLISSVRTVYHGQVTYSSNWAKGYPVWGRALDFISVDAYFPLNRPATATSAELASAWQPWVDRLARMARTYGRPLVLTEMGATSLEASFQQPWIWDNGRPIDLSAQQRYYQAACQSVVPRFNGVYWWMYSLDPPASPGLDRSYNVAGKPAEGDLRTCLSAR